MVELDAKNVMFEHLKNAVKQAAYYASNKKTQIFEFILLSSVYILKNSDSILLDHL